MYHVDATNYLPGGYAICWITRVIIDHIGSCSAGLRLVVDARWKLRDPSP